MHSLLTQQLVGPHLEEARRQADHARLVKQAQETRPRTRSTLTARLVGALRFMRRHRGAVVRETCRVQARPAATRQA